MLPLTVPLLLLALAPAYWPRVGWEGLAWGLLCGTLGSVLVWALYPRDEIPTGRLKGVFAVLSFALSMVWLKLTADAVVKICMVLGAICGARPELLGATVLAWGNALPDMANNLSLSRDGFPTMAVTACFASPLFTLLVGTSSAMAYGAFAAGGVLEVPFDRVLGAMYGESSFLGLCVEGGCVCVRWCMSVCALCLCVLGWVERGRFWRGVVGDEKGTTPPSSIHPVNAAHTIQTNNTNTHNHKQPNNQTTKQPNNQTTKQHNNQTTQHKQPIRLCHREPRQVLRPDAARAPLGARPRHRAVGARLLRRLHGRLLPARVGRDLTI